MQHSRSPPKPRRNFLSGLTAKDIKNLKNLPILDHEELPASWYVDPEYRYWSVALILVYPLIYLILYEILVSVFI